MSLAVVFFSTVVGLANGNQIPPEPSQEKIEFRGSNAMQACRSFENAFHTKQPTTYGMRKVSIDTYGNGQVQRESYCVTTEQG